MHADNKLLLFAHPRSGSSNLYRILQRHPALDILEEPFNENFVTWQTGNPDYLSRVRDIPSLDAQLTEIFARHNGVKINERCGSDRHGWLFPA